MHDALPPNPLCKRPMECSSDVAALVETEDQSDSGIHMGIDSKLNLLDGALSFSILDGVALSPSSSYYDGNFRYYGVNVPEGVAMEVSRESGFTSA